VEAWFDAVPPDEGAPVSVSVEPSAYEMVVVDDPFGFCVTLLFAPTSPEVSIDRALVRSDNGLAEVEVLPSI